MDKLAKTTKIVCRWELLDVGDVDEDWTGGGSDATGHSMPGGSTGPRVGVALHPGREGAVYLASGSNHSPHRTIKLCQRMIAYFRI